MKSFIIFFILIISISIYRFFNLMNQSPFVDEAIYGQFVSSIIKSPSINNLWTPAEAGFAPIFIWLSSLIGFLVKNPILSGRITSLVLYNLSTIILYLYLKKIHAKNIILPIFFFSFNPFIFIYSQMALMEITLIFVTLLMFFQTENTIKKPSFINITLLAFLSPILLLTKYIGIFALPYVFLRFFQEKRLKTLIKIILLTILFTVCLFSLLYPVTSQMLNLKRDFSGPTNFENQPIIENLREIFGIFTNYFHPLIIFIAVAIAIFTRNKITKTLNVIFLIQIIYFTFFTIGFYPRYLIYSVIIIMIILSSIKISPKIIAFAILALVVLYFPSNFWISQGKPKNAHIAKRDLWQFSDNKQISGEKILHDLLKVKQNATICRPNVDKFYYQTVAEAFFSKKKINFKTCKIK